MYECVCLNRSTENFVTCYHEVCECFKSKFFNQRLQTLSSFNCQTQFGSIEIQKNIFFCFLNFLIDQVTIMNLKKFRN